MELQDRMNLAFKNYVDLSVILTSDLLDMVDAENESETWRRNYIRVVMSKIESESFCFRQMAAAGLECDAPAINENERKALTSGVGFTATEEIKLVLTATFKMFELGALPDFSGDDWAKACEMFDKSHRLIHPKTPADLCIAEDTWPRIRQGANWLVDQHFRVYKSIIRNVVKMASQ